MAASKVSEKQKLAELALLTAAALYGDSLTHEGFSAIVDWLETPEAYITPLAVYEKPRFPTMPFDLTVLHESQSVELVFTLILSRTEGTSTAVEAVLYGKRELRLARREEVETALLDWVIAESEDVRYRYASEPLETLH